MNISQSIHKLLYQYDCVIIPGFGGLVCSYESAKIHAKHHHFYPPSKKISFNKMLVMNDGLLANHVASTNNVSYETALEAISGEVYHWNKTLSEGKRFDLDGVGSFNFENGVLQFEATGNVNYLLDSYGLSTFQSLPIDRKEKLKVVHSSEEERRIVLPTITKMAKYSVAAALISVAALTTYKLNLVPTIQKGYVSLNPFSNEKTTYDSVKYEELRETVQLNKVDFESELKKSKKEFITYQPDANPEIEFTVELEARKAEVATIEIRKTFHIVGGCFGVEDNAVRLVKKLKRQGYDAHIPTKLKNLHVVSYQSFASRNEAEDFLQKVKEETNSQAWLLEK